MDAYVLSFAKFYILNSNLKFEERILNIFHKHNFFFVSSAVVPKIYFRNKVFIIPSRGLSGKRFSLSN